MVRKDFDFEAQDSYMGFDLSDFDETDLPEVVDKIEAIHEALQHLKELCDRVVSVSAPEYPVSPVSVDERPATVLETVRLYGDSGDERAKEFSALVLGALENDSPSVQIAKAKAFRISYERQFEDGEAEPVHPFDFQETEVFRVMQKLTGKKAPVPSLLDLS